MLIFSQVLQGASSGTMYIICLAILAESVDARILARYIGLAMSCSGLGQVVGPVVGGVVYQEVRDGKRGVTGLGMGLAGVGVVLVLLMKKKTKRPIVTVNIDSSTHLDSNPAGTETETELEEKPSHSSSPPTSLSASPSLPTAPRIFRWKHVFLLVKSPRLLAAIYGIFVYELYVPLPLPITPSQILTHEKHNNSPPHHPPALHPIPLPLDLHRRRPYLAVPRARHALRPAIRHPV